MILFVVNDAFILLICNELSCIDQGNQLRIIINTMNINTILQPSNFNVFLHGYANCLMIFQEDFLSNPYPPLEDSNHQKMIICVKIYNYKLQLVIPLGLTILQLRMYGLFVDKKYLLTRIHISIKKSLKMTAENIFVLRIY